VQGVGRKEKPRALPLSKAHQAPSGEEEEEDAKPCGEAETPRHEKADEEGVGGGYGTLAPGKEEGEKVVEEKGKVAQEGPGAGPLG
jgi:hypothetical protein